MDRMQISNRWRTYVDVSFSDSAGKTQAGRRFVLSSAYKTGETLIVRHVKQAPGLFILEDELTDFLYVRNSLIMLAIGLVLAVFCVPGMIFFLRLTGTIRRLLRNGRTVDGEILEIKDRPYKLGHHTPKYLIYQFNDSRDRSRTGESVTIPKDREADILSAKILPVLVDPVNPDIHFADMMEFSGKKERK